ncbi:MAG: hypothetical protein OXE73_14405 [Gammaproteobacteria bacterium]|nr:hypothetical protein [Gammaproteobacteria bacterium]
MKLIGDRRSVADIQESGVLGDAVFAADRLLVAEIKVQDREHWRNRWFSRVKRQLAGCDLVFADPDNGPRVRRPFQAHEKGECEANRPKR